MFRLYADLTKFGIVIFVLLTALAGYLQGFVVEFEFSWQSFVRFMAGVYFISSGSLALNQVQEFKLDRSMNRTAKRPIASGRMTPWAGGILAVTYLLIGSDLLVQVNALTALLGWVTVILYNGFYTYWWKPKWVFAALPGAIPGALPVLMGYTAQTNSLAQIEGWYLFTLLFLWQMPHFWLLAIRYRDDYSSGQVPTLPVAKGFLATLLQIRLYNLLYIGVALLSPWFIYSRWAYLGLTIPTSLLGLFLMRRYNVNSETDRKAWFTFFMWANLSVLVYLFAPAIDRWQLIMSAFQLD